MKKIQKLALSFMMGGLALCFASCGSDDDTTFDLQRRSGYNYHQLV